MQQLDGRLVHSATDLNNFSECLHLIALERDVAARVRTRPDREDPTGDLIRRKGDEHERRYLERMRASYGDALVAFGDPPARSREGYEAAERATLAAMESGAPMIFQGTFFDGTFLGRADFLIRVDRPSARWAWSYEVIDTKLALSPKPYFLIQLCQYSEHVERLQGTAPEGASIVLGSGESRRFKLTDFAPYYRRLKAAYLASVARREDAYPLECGHCDLCPWDAVCASRRDRDDHLSLVAGMRRDQIERLEAAGITTLAALANAHDARPPKHMAAATFVNLRAQAAEQHRYRVARANGTAEHSYSFRPLEDAAGLTRLPEPAPGDIFFDMEGDPMYRPGASLEYLFGAYLPDDPEGRRYRAFWGTTPRDERTAFEDFVDFVRERQIRYPNLHVYHYAPYETTALKRLAGQFGSREDAIDDFLRRQTFVDLYPVVRQSMWISQPSYSIKKVEALYGFVRTTKTRGGDDSIVMFESWLDSQDPTILEDIRAYNEDDCVSTFRLREWLVARRAEFNGIAREPIPWRPDPEPSVAPEAPETKERIELERRLLTGLEMPDSEGALRSWPEGARGRWLLGNLIQYHWRELKSEYWEYHHRCENPMELVDDRQALGGLSHLAEIPPYRIGNSRLDIHVYSYPEQEFDLGTSPHDPDTKKSVGQIVRIEEEAQRIHIKVAAASDAPTLRAVVPGRPLPITSHQVQLDAIAASYLEGTLGRDFPATEALLLRHRPVLEGFEPGASVQPDDVTIEAVSAAVRAVRKSALVIQGPPGTGKSTSGATAIVDAIEGGKRVALVALSHKALHNLCHKVEEVAAKRRLRFNGCHKSSDSNADSPFVSRLATAILGDAADGSLTSCDLVSVTSYGWASAITRDPSLVGSFDLVVIDEAGQISLADALIVSRLASAVVLLGDPQQLPQVSKGTHPFGARASILEHMLGGTATIAPDRGIFLDRSFRLEPRIAAFVSNAFYDGRLRAASLNARNRVDSPGLSGGGLRYASVLHEIDVRRSPDEARLVADEIARLLETGTTTLRSETPRPLTQSDVLVVTPYNAQRIEILRSLARHGFDRVAVGTVDKFQGQEAPIVLYSMATSTADLAPRGIDFLLSPNRFNVAISRAEAIATVICSPSLLDSRATSIESMRLLSMLCGYVEQSLPSRAPAATPLLLPFA